MSAATFLLAGLACFVTGVAATFGMILYAARRAHRDRQAWAGMPGAVDWDAAKDAMVAAEAGADLFNLTVHHARREWETK